MQRLERILSEVLGVARERAESLLKSRTTRVLRFKNFVYIALRRDLLGHYEGTTVLIHEPTGKYRLVEGYPHIQRILLLSVAVPKHFIDKVVVEEKMDGYNVRVIRFMGELLAITRGGFICPYTTAKMRRLYGSKASKLLEYLGEHSMLAGEAVGLENPYTRFYYPEAPSWDFFVFDIFKEGLELLSVYERSRLITEYALKGVPIHGIVPKEDWEMISQIVKSLEEVGREGVVLKDPFNRVPPLKYTTSFINVRDIEEGMKFPFDEGHTFIFPRVLRQLFKAFEEDWDEDKLREEFERLGRALIQPALESIKKAAEGERVYEEFTLSFDSLEELEEYLAYAASLGVQAAVTQLDYDGKTYKARLVKVKRSDQAIRKILRTGLSPLD
jgi:putative ATP-dependent DNA ligase